MTHFSYLRLRVLVVKVAQVDEGLAHGPVLCQHVHVLHGLTHNVAALVLDHNHLRCKRCGEKTVFKSFAKDMAL